MADINLTPIQTFISGDIVLPDDLNQLAQSTVALTAGSIVAADIASDAVTTAKILDANVTTAKLADSAVTTAKVNDSAVTTAKINNAAVTAAKLAAKVTFPNYTAGVGKAFNTVHQAAEDGYLCVTLSGSFRNGIRVMVGATSSPALEIWLNGDDINSNTKVAGSGMLPIPKDIYYKVEAHPSFDGFETIVINWYPVVT